jgi:prepilin-type processing-associated H-X9-DG protein
VASDSALAEVAPQGDAILYVAHGAAFYREIRRTSADAIREMQTRADREKYLSQARQIGVALMMYVQDYDEMFPPNFGDEGVAQVLLPYLKDMGIFEVNGAFAFRYRMDGQSLANIESPATTEVGYLELPNGRMVIYADGHVKWQPRR